MKQLTKKTWYTLLLCTMAAMSTQQVYSAYDAEEAATLRQQAIDEENTRAQNDTAQVQEEMMRRRTTLNEQKANQRRTEEQIAQEPQSDNEAQKIPLKKSTLDLIKEKINTAKEKISIFWDWLNRKYDKKFNSRATHTNTSIEQMWKRNNNGAKQDVQEIADEIKNDPKERSEVINAMQTKAQEIYNGIKGDQQQEVKFKSFFNDDVLNKFGVKMTVDENGKVSIRLPNDVKEHRTKTFKYNSNETFEQNIARLQENLPGADRDEIRETVLNSYIQELNNTIYENKNLSASEKLTEAAKSVGMYDSEMEDLINKSYVAEINFKLKNRYARILSDNEADNVQMAKFSTAIDYTNTLVHGKQL